MKSTEYYFAVDDLGVDENGSSCETYAKLAFDIEVDEEAAVAFVEHQFPSLTGKLRALSRDEYIELAGDDDD